MQCTVLRVVPLAVGLYLRGQWWSAEDILKTADSSRTGLIKVASVCCHICVIGKTHDKLQQKKKGNVERIFCLLTSGQNPWRKDSSVCSQQNYIQNKRDGWG